MVVETRVTLIKKITDAADQQAWAEFVALYAPLIYRFALSRGTQHADAADITQEVFRAVARAISRFDSTPGRGRFRSWLYAIVKHKLSDLRARNGRMPGYGVEVPSQWIQQYPAPEEECQWDAEFRRHVFLQACQKVREEVSEKTWRAFHETAIEGRSPQDVGQELEMRPGTVYVARHRITRRLHEAVMELTEEAPLADKPPHDLL